MSFLEDPLFTKTFIGPVVFTLQNDSGISKFSIKAKVGTSTVVGTLAIQGIVSDAVDLEETQVLNGSSKNASCCFTLTVPPGAIAEVVAGRD